MEDKPIRLEDIPLDVREMYEKRIQMQLESAGNPEMVVQCQYCRKVRLSENKDAYWFRAITSEYRAVLSSKVKISHGPCPPCYKRVMSDLDATGII